MNAVVHIRASRWALGRWAWLAGLPDVAQALHLPNWHNTVESVDSMGRLHPLLGLAWSLHRNQDLATHHFDYQWRYEVPDTAVLLYSGGLDSYIAWKLLGCPRAIYFRLGHNAEENELAMVKRLSDVEISDVLIGLGKYEQDNGYIPYRNALLILEASRRSPDVILAQICEWAPDKNRTFYGQLERLARTMTTGEFQKICQKVLKIWTPFASLTKTALVHRFLLHYSARELVDRTWSCYRGGDDHCGQCHACRARFVAMKNNGILETFSTTPLTPEVKPLSWWRDIRPGMIAMGVKRWRELRG